MLRQHVANFIGTPHTIRHQAHIRWTHSEVVRHTRVQPKVQFVNSQEMLFIQFAFRFFAVRPHSAPQRLLFSRYSIPTYFTDREVPRL